MWSERTRLQVSLSQRVLLAWCGRKRIPPTVTNSQGACGLKSSRGSAGGADCCHTRVLVGRIQLLTVLGWPRFPADYRPEASPALCPLGPLLHGSLLNKVCQTGRPQSPWQDGCQSFATQSQSCISAFAVFMAWSELLAHTPSLGGSTQGSKYPGMGLTGAI